MSVRPSVVLAVVVAVVVVSAAWITAPARAVVPFERADLNGDGRLDSGDQLWWSILWRTSDPRADLNQDGKINSGDQLALATALLEAWGMKPNVLTPTASPGRDPLLWPFSPSSPWNMPIGSNAVYVDAGLPATFMAAEDEIIAMQPGAPLRQVIVRDAWDAACTGEATTTTTIPVPDGLLTPLTSSDHYPNNTGAFVLADGRTVREGNWAARCDPAGPLYWGVQRDTHSLYGDGVSGFVGGHGGSGLSALGGSLRHWEIRGAAPIRHALKLTISAQFLSQCNGGDRWPAQGADQGYNEPGAIMEYKGTICAVRMGSLLAIEPSENCNALVAHAFARRICWTLQNYGAYIVDSGPAWWQPHVLNVEQGGNDVVRSTYGLAFTAGPLQQQMLTLMTRLKVVDNNNPASVGGGGSPRQPLAPPLSN